MLRDKSCFVFCMYIMRIDKYIGMLGRCSRRQARSFMRTYAIHTSSQHDATMDERTPAQRQDQIHDGMYIWRYEKGKQQRYSLRVRTQVYAILHKPIGYVSSDVND